MTGPFEKERREFVRIPCAVPVRYKFLCEDRTDPEMDVLYEGTTTNLGAGGFLLSGTVPRKDWIPDLLLHKIIVGVHIWVPGTADPVRALTRMTWLESVDEHGKKYAMGLMFKEMTSADQDKVLQYIVQARLNL